LAVATIPAISRLQKLKDGNLVASDDNTPENSLVFKESWSIDAIDAWLTSRLFPGPFDYLKNKHQGPTLKHHWMLLVPRQGKLDEFVKKGDITGKDLLACRSGKGKKCEFQSLYFGPL
jgi:hypothetical protein